MADGRVNDDRNSSVLSALLQNQISSELLDSLFVSGSSTSSFAPFLGSRSMVSFEDVHGGRGSNRSLFHQYEHEDKWEDELAGTKEESPAGKGLWLAASEVAIWFQNRRARWKTKHLEKDYEMLQANYNNLKANCESLSKENDKLKVEQRQAAGESKAGKMEAWMRV
ncbi:hypothetical protein C1H46_003508 [Malus baccata]|uniref:Homeobox-leucine zipper protein n=1 Tax=Malus baccata TaxID=106549 RepID=A0A540NIT9_MALBA|nr:hypothetical protein C1H46_003508 [Malus baccata]